MVRINFVIKGGQNSPEFFEHYDPTITLKPSEHHKSTFEKKKFLLSKKPGFLSSKLSEGREKPRVFGTISVIKPSFSRTEPGRSKTDPRFPRKK